MRFVLHEQSYEKPIASGKLVYEQAGQPTGAVESWRLTEAVEGYRFLRVDLDGRAAASGNSSLFHLTLNPQGQPERLLFRFFGSNVQIKGSVLFDGNVLTIVRELTEQARQEEQLEATHFWFPSTVGLGLLAGLAGEGQVEAGMLDAAASFAPRLIALHYHEGQPETVEVMGKQWQTRPLTFTWADQTRTVCLDAHHQPLLTKRQDGLLSRETRYVRYQ